MKKIANLFVFLILVFSFFIMSCDKDDGTTEPTDNEYPAEPIVSSVFPTIVIPNGFIYITGENFGQTVGNITVKFKNTGTQNEVNGIIEEVINTKITVKVPSNIDTTGAENHIIITTPKGTHEPSSISIFGISSSAFGDDLLPGKGLVGKVYELPANTQYLPDFDQMSYKTLILAPNLDVPLRHFTAGFPGVPGGLVEWFGIRFEGKLEVAASGDYNFMIGSDDGAIIYINGNKVLENDGVHSYSESEIDTTLSSGLHNIRIDYFQGPRTEIGLRLFWTTPGGVREIVPSDVFILPEAIE